MTTPPNPEPPNEPPNREAVEAAMRYATADNATHANHAESTLEVLYGQCAWDTEHTGMMVGRILAAEVQRLRAIVDDKARMDAKTDEIVAHTNKSLAEIAARWRGES